jgi:uncharacterized protein (TIGR02302 family)
MAQPPLITPETGRRLRLPLLLTGLGLLAERVAVAFWPLWSVCLAVLGMIFLGLQDDLPIEAVWGIAVVSICALIATGIRAVLRFRWPASGEAAARLDASLAGRPLAALSDRQAIGAGDAASEAVWAAHLRRMEERLRGARTVRPDLRLSRFDRFGLRYVALTVFVTALIFGSVWRVNSVPGLAPGGAAVSAVGPSWEGWIEPPAYSGQPSLYLNDLQPGPIQILQGSRIELRLYGEIGKLTVSETVSARTDGEGSAADFSQSFSVNQSGRLSIDGPGGASWEVSLLPDAAPEVTIEGAPKIEVDGQYEQAFTARDDFGVVAGRAVVELDLPAVDRRFGLAAEPEPREPLVVDLPMPLAGSRTEFTETLVENFSKHPWAGLPVKLTLIADDAIGNEGRSQAQSLAALPTRRFFDPLAQAIIEQRRDLLWTTDNANRVSQLLRAVSYRPEGLFRSETDYLRLRVMIRRLETYSRIELGTEHRDEIAQALWDLAVLIEDGDLSDALARLQRAQDRLSEAMRDGASDQEIASLMQELRDAMQNYMQQLAQQAPQDGTDSADMQNMQTITGDQLQEMLDRLQELMEQGRTAEAQALLDQLRQMMENMQVARGQPDQQGQGGQGQQAMRGLQETLRQQQELSDDSFQGMQDNFGQPGQGQGQTPGQGQMPGEGQTPGQGQGDGPGQGPGQGQSLADRQQALRDMLNQQQQTLPGGGGTSMDAARDALDRAGRAMEGAEDALRGDDIASALDSQSEAMEALREGMRNLGDEMAQQQQPGQGQQGDQYGQVSPRGSVDPLGRELGANGRLGTSENLLQGDDVYRRARDLLDEIRRRSSDQTRPEAELEYLKRLLERF